MSGDIVLLPREAYLARVRENLPATVSDDFADDAVESIRWRLGSESEDRRLKQGLEAFLLDPEGGYAGIVEIFDIGQARAALARHPYNIENWQYDRTSRAVLVNLRRGSHESLSGALFNAYRGHDAEHRFEHAAEQFIADGLGWFKSSVSSRPMKAASVRLDAQEKAAFRGVEFRDL
jgi:hypothetical protein